MENINIAEILKDCPKGTKLYSPLCGNCKLVGVINNYIKVEDKEDYIRGFLIDGKVSIGGECLLFPSKENRDWSKFQRPFKDGDILIGKSNNPFIYKATGNSKVGSYCGIDIHDTFCLKSDDWTFIDSLRFATEEEKQKLFDAIKTNGYKWNKKTKTLEKISPFKAGDVLVSERGNIVLLSHIDNEQIVWYHCIIDTLGDFKIVETPICGVGKVYNCTLASKFQKKKLFSRLRGSGYRWNPQTNKLEKLIVPKFKVGDRIKHKVCDDVQLITGITAEYYELSDSRFTISFNLQDNYELVPDKFDISTLKPFNKVLVRHNNDNKWCGAFFSHVDKDLHSHCYKFVTTAGKSYPKMIPYEGNEHLLGTYDDCDEYYKTW